MSRIETIHANDPLNGREWGLVCFICREVSYLGPSFGCVESFGDVVVCARCRTSNAPLPTDRLARIHSGHALLSLNVDQLTWLQMPPVEDEHSAPADPTEIFSRLARAGLDVHARTYFESLPHMQQDAINVSSVLEAAIAADRDELVAWILDNVAIDVFGSAVRDLVYNAYRSLAARCIVLLRARCSLPISTESAVSRMARNDDIPMALFEPLLLESDEIVRSKFTCSRLFAEIARSWGNGAVAARLIELGAPVYSWYGESPCSISLRQIFQALNKEDRARYYGGRSLSHALVALPPDVDLMRDCLNNEDLDSVVNRHWYARFLIEACAEMRSVEMLRALADALGDTEQRSEALDEALRNALSIGAVNIADELLTLAKDAKQLLGAGDLLRHAVRGGARALAWLLERSKSQASPFMQDALFEAADLTDFRSDFVRRGGAEGVLDAFRVLRARGADLHALNDDGCSVLFVACQTSGGDLAARPILAALLGPEFGLDAKFQTANGVTLLHVTRDPVIFKQLMDVLDIETESRARITPLRAACRDGAVAVASLLLAAGVCVTEGEISDAFAVPHWGIVRLLQGRCRFAVKHLAHRDLPLDIAHRALTAGAKAAAMVRRRDAVGHASAGFLRLMLAHNVSLSWDAATANSGSTAVCVMLGAGVEPTELALHRALKLWDTDSALALVAGGASCKVSAIADHVNDVARIRLLIAAGLDVQRAIDAFPEQRDKIEAAAKLEPLVLDDARATIDRNAQRMTKTRFVVERLRMMEICVAMQALRLPALVTMTVLDQTTEGVAMSPLHWKWNLVTKVKHFRGR